MDTSNAVLICPNCGASTVAPILYGLPMAAAIEKAQRGEIVLGGCCISSDSPKWACTSCKAEFDQPSERIAE